MILRELIEVMPNDGYLTLHIEKDWYAIQVNYVNIIRPEILDMNVTNILGGRCDGEPSLTVTLKSPEVPAKGVSMKTLTEWIWEQCNEEERAEIKKISEKFDIPLNEACKWYESCNHNYTWAVGQIEEYYEKVKKED